MIVLLVVLVAYGLGNAVFAFFEPPAGIGSFFPAPSVLLFLPARYRMPAGRACVAIGCFALAFYLGFVRTSPSSYLPSTSPAHHR